MVGWIVLSSAAAALLGYTAVATLAAHRLTRPRRRLPQSTPAQAGLAYESVALPARGEALIIAGWHIPAAGATRAVIIAHGIGGCRSREFTSDSIALMGRLVESGFTLLAIDLRGHGESEGARMTYGQRERRDVLGAVDWLLARGYAPGAIGVLGASMGGVAGIGAAREEPAIGALVVDSSCADFPAMMRAHFRAFTRLPSFFLPGTLLVARLLTGENLARLRPAGLLATIERLPTLVIHAAGDRLVPSDHARALARAGGGDLWITDSPRHLGSFRADPQAYTRRVTQFFQASLAAWPASRLAHATPATSQAEDPSLMRWRAARNGQRSRHGGAPAIAHRDENMAEALAGEGQPRPQSVETICRP
jgi:alpha-beta hydrolase superfamily lysophospholipase